MGGWELLRLLMVFVFGVLAGVLLLAVLIAKDDRDRLAELGEVRRLPRRVL